MEAMASNVYLDRQMQRTSTKSRYRPGQPDCVFMRRLTRTYPQTEALYKYTRAADAPIDYLEMEPNDTELVVRAYDGPLDLSQIPDWVHTVTLNNCSGLDSIEGLSDAVTRLTIVNCQSLDWQPDLLPNNLVYLTLTKLDTVYDMTDIPKRVKFISIDGLKNVASIDGLPEGLMSIRIREMPQLRDLNSMPEDTDDVDIIRDPGNIGALPFRRHTRFRIQPYAGYHVYSPDGSHILEDSLIHGEAEYVDFIRRYDEHLASRRKNARSAVTY